MRVQELFQKPACWTSCRCSKCSPCVPSTSKSWRDPLGTCTTRCSSDGLSHDFDTQVGVNVVLEMSLVADSVLRGLALCATVEGSSHAGYRTKVAHRPSLRPTARLTAGGSQSSATYFPAEGVFFSMSRENRFVHKVPLGVTLHWSLRPDRGRSAHLGGTPCVSLYFLTFFSSLLCSFCSSCRAVSSFFSSSSH